MSTELDSKVLAQDIKNLQQENTRLINYALSNIERLTSALYHEQQNSKRLDQVNQELMQRIREQESQSRRPTEEKSSS